MRRSSKTSKRQHSSKSNRMGGYRRTRRNLRRSRGGYSMRGGYRCGMRGGYRCGMLGGYRVGGAPLLPQNNLRQPLIRLPHTRQNIIRGYAREIYSDDANRQDYIQALNDHLAQDGFSPVTSNEVDNALAYVHSIMT
jgi:hypothetical protein